MTPKTRVGLAAIVVATAAAVIAAAAIPSTSRATGRGQQPAANTATVQRGALSDTVSQYGTLTYRAQPNGSPYAVFNHARGTYTQLPEAGDHIECGGVLYRVDNQPVLLLCGATPAYRSLSQSDSGPDVAELNANLVQLGYATRQQLDPSSDQFSAVTSTALDKLLSARGAQPTGSLDLGQVVFLPEPVRIATVAAGLAGTAQPGANVLDATSDTLEVHVALDPSQQDQVRPGDSTEVILPSNHSVRGKVDRLGRIAGIPSGENNGVAGATIPVFISLDDPAQVRGLDQAPVEVNITTKGVADALSVPVTAIVGTTDGGFAVEVVRRDGQHPLVAVRLGLFDSADDRVQVEGKLHEGDRVVVPSS